MSPPDQPTLAVSLPGRRLAYSGLALGAALFVALVVAEGAGDVARALAAGGIGLFGVALFHVAPMLADALGWRLLLADAGPPPVGTVLFARWVGESVNTLLPVMQIGGNVAKANLLARRGVASITAGASVVVDMTLVMLAQIVFTVTGLLLLLAHVGGHRIAPIAAIGLGLSGVALTAFLMAQRLGLFAFGARVVARLRRGRGARLVTEGAALDTAVAQLYRRRALVVGSVAWHLASWIVGVGEVWFALYVLGHPVDVRVAVILESLGQAVRGAAFVVPGALGVQEGGFLLLGSALGIAPDTALALSLAKRVREVTLGVPGLIAWQLDWVTHARRERTGN